MRTTLDLDDELVLQAKIVALQRRTPLSRLLEDALRVVLSDERETANGPLDLPVSSGPPLPSDFPWHSGSKMIEYLEGPDARP